MGLPHLKIAGQKGWHGVAIASAPAAGGRRPAGRLPRGPRPLRRGDGGRRRDPQLLHPAGGDVPDRQANPKFDHKLDFYEKLTAELGRRDPKAPLAIVGDLNVAPGEFDVWNHKYMSKIVSHTPVEIEAMAALKASLGFIDVTRGDDAGAAEAGELVELPRPGLPGLEPRPFASDHILVTPGLRDAAFRMGAAASRIHDDVREWEAPATTRRSAADLVL